MSVRAHLCVIDDRDVLCEVVDLFRSINWAYKAYVIFKTSHIIEYKGKNWLEFLVFDKHEKVSDIFQKNLDIPYYNDHEGTIPQWWYDCMYGKLVLKSKYTLRAD